MLDPTNVRPEQVVGSYSEDDIPNITAAHRSFGYLPDVSSLRPGDLLLIQRIGGADIGTSAIRFAQRNKRVATSDFTHAGIYAGQWRVFEANPKTNISTGRLIDWIPNSKILVRRPVIFNGLPELEGRMLGAELALEAAMLQSTGRYGMKAALDVGLRLVLGRIPGLDHTPAEMRNDSIICSGLYAKCFAITMRQSLLSAEQIRTDEPITPELLARLPSLETIEVNWRNLVSL
jgi:hypothetical protein